MQKNRTTHSTTAKLAAPLRGCRSADSGSRCGQSAQRAGSRK